MALELKREQELRRLDEACRELGLERQVFLQFVHQEWVHPSATENEEWTEEDLARARLIQELREDFGVNDDAVPIILHLIDELHALRCLINHTTNHTTNHPTKNTG